MEDTFRHKGLRKKLVEQIKLKGITDERVLDAIWKIPRHLFMDSGFIEFAYKDQAFPIASGQTISQPYTVAFQTQLLQLQEGEKVLEIGTGSGYQTAILVEMKAKVFSIERQKKLFADARITLHNLGYFPQLFFGDGYEGLPTYGPFNKILITAAAPNLPKKLLSQLEIGGKMVLPVGHQNCQTMIRIIRLSETEFEQQQFGNFVFVPMLSGTAEDI